MPSPVIPSTGHSALRGAVIRNCRNEFFIIILQVYYCYLFSRGLIITIPKIPKLKTNEKGYRKNYPVVKPC